MISCFVSDEKWNCAKDKIKANLLKNDDYTKCAKAVTSKDCKALVPHLKNCPGNSLYLYKEIVFSYTFQYICAFLGYPDLDVKCLNNLTSNKASDQIFKNCIFNGASVGCIKVAQEVLFC